MLIVAFSGGKDSTAMALRLHELGQSFKLLYTPTGDELPELALHIAHVVELTGAELIQPTTKTLFDYVDAWNMLPSQKSRWCTRVLKIEPCIAWFKQNPGHTLAVGLRADEESRKGIYSELVQTSFPLQEWGWDLDSVQTYIQAFPSIKIPVRTDCALCPYQKIGEWYRLWKYHPERYQRGIELEAKTEHTFNSPTRRPKRKDGTLRWAVSLSDLAKQFAGGDKPKTLDDGDNQTGVCRVCSL